MMAQQGMSVPGVASDASNMSGQAGGGSGSVFGGLGGGQQHGTDLPYMPGGPRNSAGHPTGNPSGDPAWGAVPALDSVFGTEDRKSTRLNSSHQIISYAVFCLKKKKKN